MVSLDGTVLTPKQSNTSWAPIYWRTTGQFQNVKTRRQSYHNSTTHQDQTNVTITMDYTDDYDNTASVMKRPKLIFAFGPLTRLPWNMDQIATLLHCSSSSSTSSRLIPIPLQYDFQTATWIHDFREVANFAAHLVKIQCQFTIPHIYHFDINYTPTIQFRAQVLNTFDGSRYLYDAAGKSEISVDIGFNKQYSWDQLSTILSNQGRAFTYPTGTTMVFGTVSRQFSPSVANAETIPVEADLAAANNVAIIQAANPHWQWSSIHTLTSFTPLTSSPYLPHLQGISPVLFQRGWIGFLLVLLSSTLVGFASVFDLNSTWKCSFHWRGVGWV